MISSQNLINKICCALTTGGLTSVECCSAESALTILCQPVFSVACCDSLPNATTYNGRMVYVTNETKYYYAVCGVWSDDFSSTSHGIRWDLYAWGFNCRGQLGNNCTTNRSSPVSVVGGFTDWCQVSAGTRQTLAVRTNGTAWGWGQNYCGSLGNNSTVFRSSPVSVVGGFTDWCQISAGGFFGNNERHNLAVRTNGTAWAWGSGTDGKLGDNTTVLKSSPVSVVGGFTDWCQVSAGPDHSLGVRTNGTAWAWGSNSNGRLGDNTATTRSSPVSVVGGFTDWCQVSAAESQSGHSLAVRTNGTAWAWGCNYCGRLGDNTTVLKSSPVSVVGGFTDWCQVSGGNSFSVGLRQNGTVYAWGYANCGRLGDNSTVAKSSPVLVVGGFTDWCQISAGVGSAAAVRTNGSAWAWGQGTYGQLGNNSIANFSSPVSVIGGFTWCQVSAGFGHSLGIRLTTVGL
jgi:alpha-tubulin suppressor-like RCC1 family protein